MEALVESIHPALGGAELLDQNLEHGTGHGRDHVVARIGKAGGQVRDPASPLWGDHPEIPRGGRAVR